ncbi:pyridoxamine 5'-phosphate oxidase family protein [Isoptericola sp. NEAU-Y5]|uniref:Pyridoxamine 5'-phosphate oxidase family protein n=1 Tax=Isoptericola luteus TaxID=2879484 RepID=A0ABS7ZJQ4_9MICO|nr:pyridoxamine 5'-phosphate oxidase family protein [Isoptericola sp. NEAU-Y5]MCA5894732.1 pyridoxamine 5'-phosphate oxidase family protein [Isoptericola sp. NEAU-Y5]
MSKVESLGVADLVAFVREHGDGVLTTAGPDGAPQAAYLSLAVTDDGELVLDARATSRKVANVRRDPRVAVVVGGRDGVTLQGEGRADLPTGPDLDRCRAAYRAAFEQFAASLEDPGIVVLRVRIDWARLGDYRVAPPTVRERTAEALDG